MGICIYGFGCSLLLRLGLLLLPYECCFRRLPFADSGIHCSVICAVYCKLIIPPCELNKTKLSVVQKCIRATDGTF